MESNRYDMCRRRIFSLIYELHQLVHFGKWATLHHTASSFLIR